MSDHIPDRVFAVALRSPETKGCYFATVAYVVEAHAQAHAELVDGVDGFVVPLCLGDKAPQKIHYWQAQLDAKGYLIRPREEIVADVSAGLRRFNRVEQTPTEPIAYSTESAADAVQRLTDATRKE